MAEQEQGNAHDQAVKGVESLFPGLQDEKPEEQEEAAPDVEQEAESPGQEPTQEKPEETQEVEIDGETYLVPKKIADRFIHHADYTRKTMDLAELRRATSAERESVAIERAFTDATKSESKELALIESQLEQFKKVNWLELEPQQALQLRGQFEQLKDMRAEKQEAISAKRKEFDGKLGEARNQALEAGEKYLAQKVKGWSEETKKSIAQYALSQDFTRQEVDGIYDPRIALALYKAKQWDELQASAPTIKNKAAQAAPVIKPGSSVKQPSKFQSLSKAVKTAQTPQGKRQAIEDFMTAKFGG